jgi:hypothetical protein
MSLRRMVAVECGMCRSDRKAGSSGSVPAGQGKLPEQRGNEVLSSYRRAVDPPNMKICSLFRRRIGFFVLLLHQG